MGGEVVLAQYLDDVARHYAFHLNPDQLKLVGLIGLVAILVVIISDLPRRFRRPRKKPKD